MRRERPGAQAAVMEAGDAMMQRGLDALERLKKAHARGKAFPKQAN